MPQRAETDPGQRLLEGITRVRALGATREVVPEPICLPGETISSTGIAEEREMRTGGDYEVARTRDLSMTSLTDLAKRDGLGKTLLRHHQAQMPQPKLGVLPASLQVPVGHRPISLRHDEPRIAHAPAQADHLDRRVLDNPLLVPSQETALGVALDEPIRETHVKVCTRERAGGP